MPKLKLPKLSMEKLEPFFDRLSKLGALQRLLICIGSYAILVAPFIWFSYLPKLDTIDNLTDEYEKLERKLQVAKRKAAQYNKMMALLKEARGNFEIAKKKLPQTKEIPNLLANITASGQTSGLAFLHFEPRSEVRKDFYAEIPVAIKVQGAYRSVAFFFERLSRLSRIVNIRNIKMRPDDKSGDLSTECTAVTYRFIEAAPSKGKKGRKK